MERLRLSRATTTTLHAGSAYPWHFDAGLSGCPGPVIGTDLLGGNAPWTFDPFGLMEMGWASNPNVMVIGSPGNGKSAFGKAVAWYLAGAFGARFVCIDPKGEYRPLADALGCEVIEMHPGGTTQVNPLASDGTSQGDADRMAFVSALASVLLDRSLGPVEKVMLDETVRAVARAHDEPVLSNLVDVLSAPTDEVVSAMQKDVDVLVEQTDEMRYAFRRLVTGSVAGMFDGTTTFERNDSSRGLLVDLSRCGSDDELLQLVMLVGMRAVRQLDTVSAKTLVFSDEIWRLGTTVQTVRWLQQGWKLGRQFGRSNWAMAHRFSDLGAQADDGTALAKIGRALVGDSDTHVLFRHAKAEDAIDSCTQLSLPASAADTLTKLPRGRALVHCNGRLAVIEASLTPMVARLTYTDQAVAAA